MLRLLGSGRGRHEPYLSSSLAFIFDTGSTVDRMTRLPGITRNETDTER
jgi:hypothetical protein